MGGTNWAELLSDELLAECGATCSSVAELAAALGEALGRDVSPDALDKGARRNREKLGLRALSEYLGASKKRASPRVKPEDLVFRLSDARREEVAAADRYIVTSAMNNADLDADVWASIRQYARRTGATILVVPVRYRNPTSPGESRKATEDAWWPDEVVPYLTDEWVELHTDLWLMAHVRVNATAVNPLSGLEDLSKGASALFGHAKLQMRMVPTPQHRRPKMLLTTGSVSKRRYSDTKSGVRGEFHHSMGAAIVERDGGIFHCRSVVADESGGFYDLDRYYHPRGSRKSPGVLAMVTGDEHALFADKQCKQGTYLADDSMAKVLRPEKIVRHDVFDAYSISHHNRKDPVIQFSKHKTGHHLLRDELEVTARHIDETTPPGAENVIVSSNHHDHLLRWLKEVHAPVQEPWNADAWIELWAMLQETIEFKEHGVVHGDPFTLWGERNIKSPTRFLDADSSETIAGVLVGMHGHDGANGSRGTVRQFSKLGAKTVTGHGHTPEINGGAWRTGTSSTLRLDYTRGPSSWAHAHVLIHPNGKRQLVFVTDGTWRRVD